MFQRGREQTHAVALPTFVRFNWFGTVYRKFKILSNSSSSRSEKTFFFDALHISTGLLDDGFLKDSGDCADRKILVDAKKINPRKNRNAEISTQERPRFAMTIYMKNNR